MKRISLFLILSVCALMSAYAQSDAKLEAESAVYTDCKLIEDSKYSGGQALELTESSAKITFTYNAAEGGKYTIYLGYDGLYGAKVVNLEVNGNTTAVQGTDKLEELNAGNFILNAGDNTIAITPNWTWFRIDYVRIEGNTTTLQFDISETPVDMKAADCAKTLYSFLYDNFGKRTISGIMTGDMSSANGNVTQHEDVKAVYQASGKYPALIGFDFMNATGLHASEAWYKEYTDAAISLAKDTWYRGGIPAFTWHWRDPSHKTDDFYCKIDNKDACTMRITDAMNIDGSWNTTSNLYSNIISDIDAVADYFLALQEAGVACIFRPLHEASGAWFWWGTSGAQPYVKLYQLIFDEMVSVKGIHNVIWVWNPCSTDDADWNPGDAYHDVISIDIYNNANDHSSNYAAFDKMKTLSGGKKLIALSENGPIPDIDKEFEEDAVWSWWMPWYQTWDGKFVDKTSKEEWTKCMSDNRVITLEDHSAGWEVNTGITSQKTESLGQGTIYTLQGMKKGTRQDLDALPHGIYIVDGKKVVKK